MPVASSLLLQLADSAFPTGGFVHSGGLESAWQLGLFSREQLGGWIEDGVQQAASGALPFVLAAFDGGELEELEAWSDAWLVVDAARRASLSQGQAWITTVAAVFADRADPADQPSLVELKALKHDLRRGALHGHLAPAFGRISALLGLERSECARLFLFLHLRGLISTAVRLGVSGPMAAQRLQWHLGESVERQANAVLAAIPAGGTALDALALLTTTAPMVDLAQGHHDRLYSRLFAT
jgi:urease accessory protein